MGARKIHFFLLCTIILYHLTFGVNLSKRLNCFLCPINPVEWKKKQIQIECYFGWKGLVHSDLGLPHVGHILQIGQFGLLQSGSPCQITLMRLRICLNISVGSIFMRFNENLTRLKIFQHYSISELSVFFTLSIFYWGLGQLHSLLYFKQHRHLSIGGLTQ